MLHCAFRRPISLAALAVVFALPCAQALAWGPTGHRSVARLAARHLDAESRQEIAALLGVDAAPASVERALANLSNEPDRWREERPETSRWHYVNIPNGADDFVRARDCKVKYGQGDCIVAALEREVAVLGSATAPSDDRKEALAFVVHLVGDLHQPLHCSGPYDQGGNKIKVRFFGEATNLHSLWDSGMIEVRGSGAVELADELEDEAAAVSTSGGFDDWAEEAHAIAVDHAYTSSKSLGSKYLDANWPHVERQLARAGVRLAHVLEDALD